MENPYYEIITLIKSLVKESGGGAFSAEIGLDDEQKPIVLVNGERIAEPFWVPDSLEITEADDGCIVLCAPFEHGFLVLAKLQAL